VVRILTRRYIRFGLGLWCLTPISTIFQPYRGFVIVFLFFFDWWILITSLCHLQTHVASCRPIIYFSVFSSMLWWQLRCFVRLYSQQTDKQRSIKHEPHFKPVMTLGVPKVELENLNPFSIAHFFFILFRHSCNCLSMLFIFLHGFLNPMDSCPIYSVYSVKVEAH
jgi:hypothetical protein